MIKGTHNSLSFDRPRRWYMWFMKPFARCQSLPLEQQYANGARCFDIRVRFTSYGRPVFAHGLYELKTTETYLFNFISNAHDHIYIRLILEDKKNRPLNVMWWFHFLFVLHSRNFRNVTFFGGNRKGDWKQITEFDFKPNLIQNVGSMAKDARWYEKILPFAYAKRRNKKNMAKEYKNDDIVIYDFL